ncbi:MAG TPA: hypothetical protein VFS18_05175, partial [Actinomycetota bacterium]|nr:hypothetical protein [Actinomycetota bacterium]
EILEACTEAYADDYDSVGCYLYGSEEALEAADPQSEVVLTESGCWDAMIVLHEDGVSQGRLDNPDRPSRCPSEG